MDKQDKVMRNSDKLSLSLQSLNRERYENKLYLRKQKIKKTIQKIRISHINKNIDDDVFIINEDTFLNKINIPLEYKSKEFIYKIEYKREK